MLFRSQLEDSSESGNPRFFVGYYNVSAELWDWAKDSFGDGVSVPYQVVVESSTNSAYIVGYNTGSEECAGTFQSNPQSTYAGFLVKYSDSGSFLWGRTTGGTQCFGGSCGVYFNNVVMHPDGGVVVGGNFFMSYKKQSGAAVFGQGDWDVLVLRYDATGTQIWDYHAGGNGDDRLSLYLSILRAKSNLVAGIRTQ